MKIRRIHKLWDGQKIYVLGVIPPNLFRAYMDFYSESLEWSREQQVHHAIKKLIKQEYSELYQWLCSQDCQTTNWIDDEIFSLPYQFRALRDEIDLFDWGIGFRPNDPLETWFILRWT